MAEEELVELKPASKNIWYVLATIAGENSSVDSSVMNKNRYYWNGLMRLRLSIEEFENLRENFNITLPSLTAKDHRCIREALDKRGFRNEIIPDVDFFIDFSSTIFLKAVNFSGYIFTSGTAFTHSVMKYANFSEAIFTGTVKFDAVKFTGITVFDRASFQNIVLFLKTTFDDVVVFSNTTFAALASFQEAIFSDTVFFTKANFVDIAIFTNATFKESANFLATEFETSTIFIGAVFTKHPPDFFDAIVSENIDWMDVNFSKIDVPKEKLQINKHIIAFERLSLMMSKLEKPHVRHMFFRHEMRTRRQLDTGLRKFPSWVMNGVYELFSNYGYGFGRALSWWSGHIILGAFLLFIPAPHNWAGVVNSVATSFANAHSFLGLNRGPLKTVYAEYSKWEWFNVTGWDWFNVIWTVQGLLGIMFLFFLILTIRNRFKMG